MCVVGVVRWFEVDERLSETLSAWQWWRTCMNVTERQLLTAWHVTAVSTHQLSVSLAIYARQHAQPTHARFDELHVLHVRQTTPVRTTFMHYYHPSVLTHFTHIQLLQVATLTMRDFIMRTDCFWRF